MFELKEMCKTKYQNLKISLMQIIKVKYVKTKYFSLWNVYSEFFIKMMKTWEGPAKFWDIAVFLIQFGALYFCQGKDQVYRSLLMLFFIKLFLLYLRL